MKNPAENVLVITYYWPPAGGAGVQRILKFVKYLPSFGITPFVLSVDAAMASYAVFDPSLGNEVPSSVQVRRTPTREPFSFYRSLLRKKTIPSAGFAGEDRPGVLQRAARFIRGNMFIPDARVGWNRFAMEKAKEIISQNNIRTVIISTPPHSSQLIGLELKKQVPGIRWIADLRDPWTDIYYYKEFYHLPFARKKDAKMEQNVLENADEILTVSPSLARLLRAKVQPDISPKLHIIPNGFDEDDFMIPSSPPPDKLIITYTGTLAASYKPQIFAEALGEIIQRNPEIPFLMRFVGSVSREVLSLFEKHLPAKSIEVLTHLPHAGSIRCLMNSTVLLLVIPHVENAEGILTGKLFEYLASRKPIVCIGPTGGDASSVIKECEAGKTFDRDMKEELFSHLQQMADEWKKSPVLDLDSNNYRKYSRSMLTRSLAEIIKRK